MLRLLFNYKYHFLIFFFSFFLLAKFQIDPDLGWHLAIGEHFIRTGEILKTDIFSWTLPGHSWGNSYFVYQLIVAFLINDFGLVTTGILFGLLGSLAVFILLPRRINMLTFLVICLGVVVARSNLGIRPHMISFFMFALLLVLLKRGFYTSIKSFVFWILFFLVWANLHNGFLIGLGFFGLFVAIDVLSNRKRRQLNIKKLVVLGLLLIVGTLATPFGLRLWQSILNDAFYLNMYFSIAEWLSVAFFFPENVIYAASGVIFIFLWFRCFNKVRASWMLTSSLFFTLPFLGVYFEFFWAAVFIFMISHFLPIMPKIEGDFMALLPVYFGVLTAFLVAGLSFFLSILESGNMSAALAAGNYPVAAVKFIEKSGPLENIYNDYAWGGYILWQLPKQKVFIDGRMTGWRNTEGRYLFKDYLDIATGKRCELLDKYEVKSALVRSVSDWDCEGMFREVYRDEISRVLVRI